MATASVLLLGAIVAAVEAAGIDRAAFLRELCVDPAALRNPEGRVPLDVVALAWERAAERTDDDAFGLHFGERTPFGAFDVIDWTARSSATASDAAARLSKIYRLLNDAARVTLSHDASESRFTYRIDAPWTPGLRHATEAALAACLARVRRLTRVHVVPRVVRFSHGAPARLEEYRRFFGTSVEFGAPVTELVFARASEDLRIAAEEDSTLRPIVDREARAMLERLPAASLASTVASSIAGILSEGAPTLRAIASRLGMTPRSLQRRLAAEKTSFQEILDEVRRDQAMRHLESPQLEIAEIAQRLGFSEPAAFHRAFRRWTKTTPLAWRRRIATRS